MRESSFLRGSAASWPGLAQLREEGPEFLGHACWLAAVVGCQVAAAIKFDPLCPGQDAGQGVEGGLKVGRALAAAQQQHFRGRAGEGMQGSLGLQDELCVVVHGGDECPQRDIAAASRLAGSLVTLRGLPQRP